jgi:hypothetical protein
MKKINTNFMMAILVLGMLFSGVTALGDEATQDYSVWVGSHYTDFNDYSKKVGEYNLGNDNEVLPEVKGYYRFRDTDRFFNFDAHYYDQKNIKAHALGVLSDRFSGELFYRSLVHQQGQDLLANLETRELGGGKILTHELKDVGEDYYSNRHEFGGKVDVLLSRENNIKLIASHRSVIRSGYEQKIATNHCYSCHVTSQAVNIDKRTHQFEAGIQGDVDKLTVGYQFGFRIFNSEAHDPLVYYDSAMHPVFDSLKYKIEFPSRLNYDDTILAYGTYPETEKTSHKIRIKGEVGKGQLSSALIYNQTKNKTADLTADAWSGALNYTVPLSKRTRLIARASGARLTNDMTYVEVRTFREGRPALLPTADYITDFNFDRYSALDRFDGKVTAEIISRLSPRLTLNVLAGFHLTNRYDYPLYDYNYKTKQFIGEAGMRYRKGLRYAGMLKYRFEKTSDPFQSFRGIFEARGYDVLEPAIITVSGTDTSRFIFYYQREQLRYQDITTLPTDRHEFEFSTTYRPDMKYSLTAGLKGSYDKNGDLDSLDVKHLDLRPNLALTMTPTPKWSMMAGYTFGYNKSRGPVTVALFDG